MILLIAGDIGSIGVGTPPEPEVVRPSLLCHDRSRFISDDDGVSGLLDSKSIGVDVDKLDCVFNRPCLLIPRPKSFKAFLLGEESVDVTSGVVGADLAESLIFCNRANVLLKGACP